MKISAVFILGLLLGIMVVSLRSNHAPNKTNDEHKSWAQDGVKIISSQTDSSKQLEEAEKYYGKAVVLFLASLYAQ